LADASGRPGRANTFVIIRISALFLKPSDVGTVQMTGTTLTRAGKEEQATLKQTVHLHEIDLKVRPSVNCKMAS
jgi:hypothetical protein